MWFLGLVLIAIGLACVRLGRYLDRVSFGASADAFAAGILIRFAGAALVVVGALRVVGVL